MIFQLVEKENEEEKASVFFFFISETGFKIVSRTMQFIHQRFGCAPLRAKREKNQISWEADHDNH